MVKDQNPKDRATRTTGRAAATTVPATTTVGSAFSGVEGEAGAAIVADTAAAEAGVDTGMITTTGGCPKKAVRMAAARAEGLRPPNRPAH